MEIAPDSEPRGTAPRSRVWPAALFQAFFVAGVAVLKASATAMVVARLGASYLPPLYVAAALCTAVLAAIQGMLTRTSLPPRATLLGSAALSAALGAFAWEGSVAAAVALYLFAEVYATLVSVRYWAAMGETFDPREAKRVFGVLIGAGMAGSMAGGLLAATAGERLGAAGFVPVAAATMLVCRLFAGQIVRRGGPALTRAAPAASGGLSALRADPYARSLAVLVALLAALTVCVDYLFRLRAAHSRTEDELASLFGLVNLWVGVGAAIFQFAFAGRVLARFGIFRYLLIVPALCFGLAAASAVMPGVWPAFVLKVVETTGSLSVNPTALQLLYAPLPDTTRALARAVVDGLVKKGGLAAGGAGLLLLGGFATEPIVALLAGAAAVGVAAAAAGAKPRYVQALDARLSRSRWSSEIELDGEARRLLLAALGAAEPQRVLTAVALLEDQHPQSLRPKLPLLLHHGSERVRERAVRIAAALRATEAIPRLREMAVGDERRPRDEAVRVLGALDPSASEVLSPLLSSADPGLRAAAVGALVRFETDRGASDGPATAALEAMLRRGGDASDAERRETARLLGELVEVPALRTRYASSVEGYLRDQDPSVRRIAATAAGRARLMNLIPLLVDMLGGRAERRAAREGLARYGDEGVAVLAAALNDRSLPAGVRYEIPRMLRYLGTVRAAEALLFSNIQDDAFLRYRIAIALSRMRQDRPQLPVDERRVREAIGRRADAYAYYRSVYADLLRALPPRAILLRALGDRLDQNLEIIFRLLGLLHAHDTVMRAFYRFVSLEPRDRPYALELLDNVLPVDLTARLAPVLEQYHRLPLEEGEVERAPARLLELLVSRDNVLRGAAIYTARRLVPEAAKVIPIPEEGIVSENVIEKVFLIEGVDIFRSSDVDDLTALAAIAREKRFETGEVIYREGDPGETLYVIVEGAVEVVKDQKPLLTLGVTESFGETSLLDGAPRPAGAIAAKPTRVLRIERQDFLDLVSDRPELLKGVFAAVTRHLRLVLEVAVAGKLSAPRAPEPTSPPGPTGAGPGGAPTKPAA